MTDNRSAEEQCGHAWETGSWGVIIGASRCMKCGIVARSEYFPTWLPADGDNLEWVDRQYKEQESETHGERCSLDCGYCGRCS